MPLDDELLHLVLFLSPGLYLRKITHFTTLYETQQCRSQQAWYFSLLYPFECHHANSVKIGIFCEHYFYLCCVLCLYLKKIHWMWHSGNTGLTKALLQPVNTNLFKSNHISIGQKWLVLSVSYKYKIVIRNSYECDLLSADVYGVYTYAKVHVCLSYST